MEANPMISNLIAILYGVFCGVIALLVIKFNQNPHRLTKRGKCFVFIVAIVLGFLLAQYIQHVEWNCDLRPQATTPCEVRWR
jgi:hypothetical protein